jgi:hypothetical protein
MTACTPVATEPPPAPLDELLDDVVVVVEVVAVLVAPPAVPVELVLPLFVPVDELLPVEWPVEAVPPPPAPVELLELEQEAHARTPKSTPSHDGLRRGAMSTSKFVFVSGATRGPKTFLPVKRSRGREPSRPRS